MTAKKTAAAAPEAAPATTADPSADGTQGSNPGATTLDSDVTKPSVTAPGDGPADTTDPTEIAVSVPPQPGDEAIAVGTVNAVKPVTTQRAARSKSKDRFETYEAVRPDGSKVTIRRNIETGEAEVV